MRSVKVYVNGTYAGIFDELIPGKEYGFRYDPLYQGPPVSLTMPVLDREFSFDRFPPFFDGLLPEGMQLDGLLRINKIDKNDFFSQLIAVGGDMVGAITVEEAV
jgi:serine/threonine-protein kinase HipA